MHGTILIINVHAITHPLLLGSSYSKWQYDFCTPYGFIFDKYGMAGKADCRPENIMAIKSTMPIFQRVTFFLYQKGKLIARSLGKI